MGNLQDPKHCEDIKTEEDAKFQILGWIKRMAKIDHKIDLLERDKKFANAEILTIMKKFDLGRWFNEI